MLRSGEYGRGHLHRRMLRVVRRSRHSPSQLRAALREL